MPVLGRRRSVIPPQPRRPITGSAVKISTARGNASYVKGLKREWQERALGYVDIIPEAHYASDFFGDGLAKLNLFIQREEAPGQWVDLIQPEDRTDPAVEYWAGIRDPSGGTRLIQSQYGRLVSFATGDSYLTAWWDDDRKRVVWELLSINEIKPSPDGRSYERRKRRDAGQSENLREPGDDVSPPANPGEARVYRFWRQDDEYSDEADAPMRGVVDVCEELHLMRLAVRSKLRSRLSRAGVFAISDQFIEAEALVEPEDGMEDEFETSPLLKDMTDHFLAPIEDDGTAAAVVPYLLVGPPDAIEKGLKYIQLFDPADTIPEIALRRETTEEFARGVKLPVEIILGMGQANHWSAWMVDDSTWKAHLQPEANRMVADFTEILLRPALNAANEDGEAYRVWYDATELVVNPDRSKDWMQAHRQRAISDRALRDAIGAQDDDMPTPENPNSVPGSGTGSSGDTGAVRQEEPQQGTSGVDGSALQHARGVAVQRCLEAAGARIRGRLPESDKQAYRSVPNQRLAATLGEQRIKSLNGHMRASDLVAGASSCLRSYLEGIGVGDVDRWCAEVEAYAAGVLFREDHRAIA